MSKAPLVAPQAVGTGFQRARLPSASALPARCLTQESQLLVTRQPMHLSRLPTRRGSEPLSRPQVCIHFIDREQWGIFAVMDMVLLGDSGILDPDVSPAGLLGSSLLLLVSGYLPRHKNS